MISWKDNWSDYHDYFDVIDKPILLVFRNMVMGYFPIQPNLYQIGVS